jgi:hypothetical protein
LILGQTILYGQFGRTSSDIPIEKLNGVWNHQKDDSAIVEISGKSWLFKYIGDLTVNDLYNISIKDTIFGDRKTTSKILVLTSTTNQLEYEILGLNDQILSLMYLPAGRFHLYYRRTKTGK